MLANIAQWITAISWTIQHLSVYSRLGALGALHVMNMGAPSQLQQQRFEHASTRFNPLSLSRAEKPSMVFGGTPTPCMSPWAQIQRGP